MAIIEKKNRRPVLFKDDNNSFSQPKRFKVKNTEQVFRVMSDFIYTRKEEAVLREASTNAYDSHVKAGKANVPIEVHLPTYSSPHLSINDFGIGLGFAFYIIGEEDESTGELKRTLYKTVSHIFIDKVTKELEEQGFNYCNEEEGETPEVGGFVMVDEAQDLYTSYGSSGTYKLESNDYVGCLGIGSKSPFCYTNSFQVFSYFDGYEYSYQCNKDQFGIPTIIRVGIRKTDRCNGLKVVVPTRTYDSSKFADIAKKLFKYFKVTPIITGQDITIEDVEYKLVHSNGRWAERVDKVWCTNQANVIMGNIAYPININNFSDLDSKLRTVLGSNIDFFVPIGFLEIAASREELAHTKKNVNRIEDIAGKVIEEYKKQVLKEIANKKTLWSARTYAASLLHTIGGVKKFVWKETEYDVVDQEEFKENNIVIFCILSFGRKSTKQTRHISYFGKPSVYEIDTNDFKDRISSNFRNDDRAVKFITDEAKKAFLEKLGMSEDELKKTSELKYSRYYGGRNTRGRSLAKIYSFKPDSYADSSSPSVNSWYEEDVDLTEVDSRKIYVVLHRYDFVDKNGKISKPYVLQPIISTLRLFGIIDEDEVIYGVRKNYLNKVEKCKHFILLEDFISNNLEFIKNEIPKALGVYHYNRENSPFYNFVKEYNDGTYSLGNHSRFRRFIEFINGIMNATKVRMGYHNKDSLERFCYYKGIKLGDFVYSDTNTELEELYIEYPLIRIFLEWSSKCEFNEDVVDYIKMIDEKKRESIDD